MRLIFKRKYLFHLLVWLMLAVFMLTEMQYYIKQKGWLFVLGPLLTSLPLMAILVYTNTLVLIPRLLQKKRMTLYIIGVIVVIVLYSIGRSMAQKYWDGVVWPEDPMKVGDYIHVNF